MSLMNIIYFSEEQDLSSSQISTDLASPLRIDFSDEEEVGAENYSQQRHLYSNSNPRRSQRNLKNPKLKFEEPALHPTRRRQLLTANGKKDFFFQQFFFGLFAYLKYRFLTHSVTFSQILLGYLIFFQHFTISLLVISAKF